MVIKKGLKKEVQNTKSSIISELAPYSTMGIQLVLTIALFAWAGWELDEYFETKPFLLIILTFLGASAGMVTFIKTAMRKNNKNKK